MPILITLVLMMFFNWPAKWSLLVSLGLAVVFGFFFWNIPLGELFAGVVYGMMNSADVLIIITGAILRPY